MLFTKEYLRFITGLVAMAMLLASGLANAQNIVDPRFKTAD